LETAGELVLISSQVAKASQAGYIIKRMLAKVASVLANIATKITHNTEKAARTKYSVRKDLTEVMIRCLMQSSDELHWHLFT